MKRSILMSVEHVQNLIIGSSPNTDRLGADRASVELDARGYIRVNDRLQTSAPDVWATGECAGSPQFTHVGANDCRIVLDNLAGGSRTTRGRRTRSCATRSGPTRPPLKDCSVCSQVLRRHPHRCKLFPEVVSMVPVSRARSRQPQRSKP
jgi:hypothetical protein